MNLLHLKYAVEVEKTRSINKAAENLYMNQPNLSRAIKELEESLGITIFKRTSKGILITEQGEEFLVYARKILAQVDEVEAIYKHGQDDKLKFSISVPRASYISAAFSEFVNGLDKSKKVELFYKETNSLRAISNILQSDYRLGILRYQETFEEYFNIMLREKNLDSQPVAEFKYVLIMSREHPLAEKEEISFEDLTDYTQIAHADPYVPSLPLADVKKAELPDNVKSRVFVYERASQFELLERVNTTFMWVSPVPQAILDKYGLVERSCVSDRKAYKDILIFRNNYKLTELDKAFVERLMISKKEFLG